MRLIPKGNTLLKSILLYRRVRHRGGHGVHSPFAFNLITKVIKETYPYYHFNDIELIRKQLLFRDELITYTDKHNKQHNVKIAEVVKREAISAKEGALLFRLAHYFNAKNALQIGSTMGLSTLYLTSYHSDIRCISLENKETYSSISKWVYSKAARNPIDIRCGNYRDIIGKALSDMPSVDIIFFNLTHEEDHEYYFNICSEHIHDKSVLIVKGIKENLKMRSFWKKICSHPNTSVTFDLYSLGIVFFNKKLHKRNYIVYF